MSHVASTILKLHEDRGWLLSPVLHLCVLRSDKALISGLGPSYLNYISSHAGNLANMERLPFDWLPKVWVGFEVTITCTGYTIKESNRQNKNFISKIKEKKVGREQESTDVSEI